jgi:hypothetical protein
MAEWKLLILCDRKGLKVDFGPDASLTSQGRCLRR